MLLVRDLPQRLRGRMDRLNAGAAPPPARPRAPYNGAAWWQGASQGQGQGQRGAIQLGQEEPEDMHALMAAGMDLAAREAR